MQKLYLLWGWEVLCCVLDQLSITGQIKCSVFQSSILILFQLEHAASGHLTQGLLPIIFGPQSHPWSRSRSARVRVPGTLSYSHHNIRCCWNVHISEFALYVVVVSPPPRPLISWSQAILIFSALLRWVSSPRPWVINICVCPLLSCHWDWQIKY